MRISEKNKLSELKCRTCANYSFKHIIWDKVFKNGPNKICGRQPLKDFTWSVLDNFVPFIPMDVYIL